MDRNGVLAVILLVLIVAEGSDASLLGKFRRMVGITPESKPTNKQVSPSPSPVAGMKNPQGSKGQEGKTPGTTNNEAHGDTDNPGVSQEEIGKKCEGLSNRCLKQKNMTACLRDPENGSQQFYMLIKNVGESTLKVNVTVVSLVNRTEEHKIRKHQAIRINASESLEIVLNAGNGICVIHTGVPVSESSLFWWIPYAHLLTPIYGAYFLFLTVLVVGGAWACCKFQKGVVGVMVGSHIGSSRWDCQDLVQPLMGIRQMVGIKVGMMTGMRRMQLSHQGDNV